MSGGDLKKLCGTYKNDKGVALATFQVIYALKYMCELNICHGDIKADNALLGESIQEAKVRRGRKDRNKAPVEP